MRIKKAGLPLKKWQSGCLVSNRKKSGIGKTRNFPSQSHDWFGFVITLIIFSKIYVSNFLDAMKKKDQTTINGAFGSAPGLRSGKYDFAFRTESICGL